MLARDGVVLLRSRVPPSMLADINAVVRARAAHVMAALGNRPIGIGSRDGYHELVQRSPGRFDVPLTDSALEPVWGAAGSLAPEVPWLGVVREALGPGAKPTFCGVSHLRLEPRKTGRLTLGCSRLTPSARVSGTGRLLAARQPGSAVAHRLAARSARASACARGQRHVLRPRSLERLPLSTPFACAALLPRSPLKCGARHPHRLALHDVPLEAGPTEVARGSHRLTNHLNGPPGALSRDDLLYQSAREATPLGWNRRPPVCRAGLPKRAAWVRT